MDKISNTLFANILDNLDTPWFVDALFLVIVGWSIIVFYTLLHQGEGRKRFLNIVRHTYAEPYRERLQRFLDYTANYWFKDYQSIDMKPRNHVFGTSVLTEPSFEFLLRLAIIYPIIALYLVWLFTGNSGSFGDLEILSANVPISKRAFITILFFVIFHLFKKTIINSGWKQIVYLIAGVGGAVAVVGGGGAVAVVAVGVIGVIGVVGAVGVGVGVGVGVFILYEKYKDTSKIVLFWIGLYILYILLFAGVLSILPLYFPIINIHSFSILFFLSILPLLNAPLDWLSLGITRSLLYSITTRIHSTWKIVGLGFADFFIALFFLFLITLFTTLTIAGLNTLLMASSGKVLINLPKVFADLRSNPWDSTYYWLYFMFLSTLIPTMFHALIAVMSVVFFIPKKTLQNWASDWVEEYHKEDFPTFLKVWAYLSFMPPLAYLIVPTSFIFLLWLILIDWGGGVHIGISLLDFMEAVANRYDPAFKV